MSYKIRKTQSSPTHFICEFINEPSSYFIKFSNSEFNISELNELLKIDFNTLELNKITDLPNELLGTKLEKLLDQVINCVNQKPIELSRETSSSIVKNPVLYSYRHLTAFQDYWKGYTPYALFKTSLSDLEKKHTIQTMVVLMLFASIYYAKTTWISLSAKPSQKLKTLLINLA